MQTVGTEDLTVGHEVIEVARHQQDRSVLLWVYPKFEEDPKPPPRRVPPRPKVSRQFKLAMLTGLSVSQGFKFSRFLKGKVGGGVAVDTIFSLLDGTPVEHGPLLRAELVVRQSTGPANR